MITNVHVRLPSNPPTTIAIFAEAGEGIEGSYLNLDWLREQIANKLQCDTSAWSLRINHAHAELENHLVSLPDLTFVSVEVLGSLHGGKGGFGTLLRGKGARGARTTNFESSRDLQGRRLRNAKAPERMRNWVQRKAQEKAIIKAVGGQDKYIGKPLSAQEVIKYYNITVPEGVYNPFEDQDSVNQFQEELRLSAAQAAISVLDKIDKDENANEDRGLSQGSASSDSEENGSKAKKDARYEYMNSYLNVFDDL
eukprot:Gregarina_sp_Pseudo_9__1965@NODE_2358_length_1026_cov_11_065856_g2171_i0_p1_GENE_NODE_2358_length_1026_cov_11_065856_g2171_i0NODE_2358_length_1026_cov_11_065856_g2171_i0_p1_ORF_typecomplete_len253_score12_06Sde2_N_Ubi/PF13019_6/2_2e22Sde2_N_Ubi/PF13019_6/3_9e03_NODE_2358_length_1026_cov_11_065856_g2171_i0124882